MSYLDGLAAMLVVGVSAAILLPGPAPRGDAFSWLLLLLGTAVVAALLQPISRWCRTPLRSSATLVLAVALAADLARAPPPARGLAWAFVAVRALHWCVQLLLLVAPPAPDAHSLQPVRGLLTRALQGVRGGLMSPRFLPWAAMSTGLCIGLAALGAIPIIGFQLFYLFAILGLMLAPVATLALVPAIVVLMLQEEVGRIAKEEVVACRAPPCAPEEDLAILGLEPGATTREVNAAYHRLAFASHPDRAGQDPAAAERFHCLSEARSRLLRRLRSAA